MPQASWAALANHRLNYLIDQQVAESHAPALASGRKMYCELCANSAIGGEFAFEKCGRTCSEMELKEASNSLKLFHSLNIKLITFKTFKLSIEKCLQILIKSSALRNFHRLV